MSRFRLKITPFWATVAVAACVVAGGASVFSQQAGSAGPVSVGSVFDLDGADVKPEAFPRIKAALRPSGNRPAGGGCPQETRFTIVTRKGDALFQPALAQARLNSFREAMVDQFQSGILADILVVSGRYTVESEVTDAGSDGEVRVEYGPLEDKQRPTLNTTSVPRQGSKVGPEVQIQVTMVARDNANPYQTGIKLIQLTADPGGLQQPVGEYGSAPSARCGSRVLERTLVVTYRVPSNPPPIVRLTALAEDYKGLQADADVAEFPTTGDWYGTLEFSTDGVTAGVRTTIRDQGEIVLTYDGRGNLEGTLVANRSFKQNSPDCPWEVTIPNKLRGKLLGLYTPGAEVMSLQLVEPVIAPAPRKDCPGGGYVYSGDSIHEIPQFKSVLRNLRAAGAGIFRSSTEWEYPSGYTNRISLTLRRARPAGNP
ncbi:MAG: hypothetical protein ACT4OT_08135 [Acidobacteriota bacterium]